MNYTNPKLKIILIILIPFLFISFSLAKYISNRHENFLYEAKSFYFESDLLSDSTEQKSYSYQRGIDSIRLNLSNNADELRYSEVNIEYKVSITDLSGNNITDKNGNVVSTVEGTLKKGEINTTTIEFNNLSTGAYIVTAETLKPYKKLIQANFILTEADNAISYEVSDAIDSPILNLIINTKDYAGNIKISWPKGVAPDNTDSYFKNVNTGYSKSNITIRFESNSEYIFNFFKEDPSSAFDSTDFTVEGVE